MSNRVYLIINVAGHWLMNKTGRWSMTRNLQDKINETVKDGWTLDQIWAATDSSGTIQHYASFWRIEL